MQELAATESCGRMLRLAQEYLDENYKGAKGCVRNTPQGNYELYAIIDSKKD